MNGAVQAQETLKGKKSHKPTKHDYECRCREYQYIIIGLLIVSAVMTYMYLNLQRTYEDEISYNMDGFGMCMDAIGRKADAQIDCEHQCDSLKTQVAQLQSQNKTCEPSLPSCNSQMLQMMMQMCVNKTSIGVDCVKFKGWVDQVGNATMTPCEVSIVGQLANVCGLQDTIELDCQTIVKWEYGKY